ncbi:hypothetical protein PGT21_026107 [Puccinia graminis f. sp. tritici]|uniref:Uncharacterized protein n=1 Tax=Puccinia graminis f. sp. tritici TaxID=56615 RepID=A0A5B0MVE7_PUCGR|nr:hypothetical protein PGT21_026107 [Puccinia graminis f. sp. tritici]
MSDREDERFERPFQTRGERTGYPTSYAASSNSNKAINVTTSTCKGDRRRRQPWGTARQAN